MNIKKEQWLLVSLPILIATVFLSLLVLTHWPLWQRPFRSDFSPAAWLSSAQIYAIAFITLRLMLEKFLGYGIGFWLFLSTLAMALDEQFQFHELWKYSCNLGLCQFMLVRELPIILVGLIGFFTMLALHRIVQEGPARFLLWSAIAIGILAVAVDQIDYLGAVSDFEEGFEVLSEAFFLAGLLAITSRRDGPGAGNAHG